MSGVLVMKIGEKNYKYLNSYDTKAEAKRAAESVRNNGRFARVIFMYERKKFGSRTYSGKRWAVYVRGQS